MKDHPSNCRVFLKRMGTGIATTTAAPLILSSRLWAAAVEPRRLPLPGILAFAFFQWLEMANPAAARAEQAATILADGNRWTLRNETLQAALSFANGSLWLESFSNRAAGVEYAADKNAALFEHQIGRTNVAANDGGWALAGARVSDITLFNKHWGRRLEVTLARKQPVDFAVRQVFELYDGRTGVRALSFIKNYTEAEFAITASDVLRLGLPGGARELDYVAGRAQWETGESLARGGRTCMLRYAGGHGVFISPENNWATSPEGGAAKGLASEKLLYVDAFATSPALRVVTNPKAVQLTLFPLEEVEYFPPTWGYSRAKCSTRAWRRQSIFASGSSSWGRCTNLV